MSEFNPRDQLFHQAIRGGLADGHGNRDRHATLAGGAVARTDQGIDRLVHVGVGHHDGVVLGTTEALAAFAAGGRTLIDILRDRRGADEADGLDVGIVEDRIHRFLVAIDDVEDARRQSRLDHQLRQHHRHAGIALGGFQDKGIAAGDRRGKLPHRNHGGEIERRDAGDHAQGLTERVDVDAGTGAFGVFALHQVGNADSKLDDLKAALNVALGVGNGLAVLARQNVGELVVVALRQFEELHHHARPALRIGCGPLRLSSTRILDGGAQLRLGGERDLGLDVAGHRLENISKPAGCTRNLTAANEMPDLTHAFLQNL